MNLLISCEHAGNKIPRQWKERVRIPQKVLDSHRGYDIGARELARHLSRSLKAPYCEWMETRLLIEPNRSLHHRQLFSEFTEDLLPDEKQKLIKELYLPYRDSIQRSLESLAPVIHLSIHSFTPVLNNQRRNADIGLLYDPQRAGEKTLCRDWAKLLGADWRVRKNYPYRGTADGLTTFLRRQLGPKQYVGVEVEVMNSVLLKDSRQMGDTLISSFRSLIRSL